jgi:hypothetical protein
MIEIWFLKDRDGVLFLPLGFSKLNNDYAKSHYKWVFDLWLISIRNDISHRDLPAKGA